MYIKQSVLILLMSTLPLYALPVGTEGIETERHKLEDGSTGINYDVTKAPCYSEEELMEYLSEAGLVKVQPLGPHPRQPFLVGFLFVNEDDTKRELWVTDIRTGGSHFCIKGYGIRLEGEEA